ncbi:MAG: hypothetical protein KDJ77_14495 [Rhodobiaceae bacterium]|nr:hypothetical protein [Rhodobiaceae bacterium]
MRKIVAAAIVLLATNQTGMAETCEETFARLLVHGNGEGPVRIHIVQEVKGGQTSTNEFLMVNDGHWMTRMIDPASGWYLTYDNVMYQSQDEGKSWTKVRDVDSAGDKAASIRNLEENATTTANAVCGEEDLDGAMHDTVEADFDTLQAFKTHNHYKYWVDRQSGLIVKATYETRGEGFESFTTQTPVPAPDLTLPVPD